MENKKVPSLRFKGFTEAWEQRKAESLFDCGVRNNTLSRADLSMAKGEVCDIHYGDVLIKYGSILNCNTEQLPYIVKGKSTDYQDRLLKDGDIVMADTAEDETAGKVCEILNTKGINISAGLHTFVFRPIIPFAPTFLGHYLNSESYHQQLLPLMQGIKVLSLGKVNVNNTLLRYPKAIAEQSMVGEVFNKLDNLITLHQRKLDMLQNAKKSFLGKMFPKTGKSCPVLRFKGFTEAWEQRNNEDICFISTGKSNTQDSVENGPYPFYVRSPIIERSNRFLYDQEAVLTVGDGVGTGKVFHYVNGKYDLHQRVYRMYDFSSGCLGKYFYYYFSIHFNDRVMSMTAKTSVDSVRYEMISKMKISLPSVAEQEKIYKCIENIDNLITLHQRKLEKLQNLKKAYLDKMFV